MDSTNILEITLNSFQDDNKIELSSNNLEIIIDEKNDSVITNLSKQSKPSKIDNTIFNNEIPIHNYQTEIWETKNIWDIDIPDKQLKKYLFQYFQKKIKLRSNLQTIQKIKQKTSMIYNIIDQIQQNKQLFDNPIQIDNPEINNIISNQYYSLQWIYPIIHDIKKIYDRSEFEIDKSNIINSQNCFIPESLDYYDQLNLNLYITIIDYLNKQDEIEQDELQTTFTQYHSICNKIYLFLTNYFLFDKQTIDLTKELEKIYKQYTTKQSINDILNENTLQTPILNQKEYYITILQLTNEEFQLFIENESFFTNLIIQKKEFFTDYITIKSQNELSLFETLHKQLYTKNINLPFTRSTDNEYGKSHFQNLIYNGSKCSSNNNTMVNLIPIFRNYLNYQDLQMENNLVLTQKIQNTQSLLRFENLLNKESKLLFRNSDKNITYSTNTIIPKKSTSSQCGDKKSMKLYIDPTYNNNENVIFKKNGQEYHIDWYPVQSYTTEELFISGEKVNIMGYYIDNQKLQTKEINLNYHRFQKTQIGMKKSYLLSQTIPDGYNLNHLVYSISNYSPTKLNTLFDYQYYNKYFNYSILYQKVESVFNKIKEEIIEKLSTEESIKNQIPIIQQQIIQKMNYYLLTKIIPNYSTIENYETFSSVTNQSDINQLLSIYGLNYDDLLMTTIQKIQKNIKLNISKNISSEKYSKRLVKQTSIHNNKCYQIIEEINLLIIQNSMVNGFKNLLNTKLQSISLSVLKKITILLKIKEHNQYNIKQQISTNYTKQILRFYISILKQVSQNKITNIKQIDNKIHCVIDKIKIVIQDQVLINKIEQSEVTNEKFYYKSLISQYLVYRYYKNNSFNTFILNPKYINEIIINPNEYKEFCNTEFITKIKNYYQINFKPYCDLFKWNEYLMNQINQYDNGDLYNCYQQYLFTCIESYNYKKIIETITIRKINKITKYNPEIPQFKSTKDILDSSIDYESYIDHIKKNDLHSYETIIESSIQLLQITISNYNNYNLVLDVVKLFSTINEINDFNADRNPQKKMKKSKNTYDDYLLQILQAIISTYTKENIYHNHSLLFEVFQNNKIEITKEFKPYLIIQSTLISQEEDFIEQKINTLLQSLSTQNNENQYVSLNEYGALIDDISTEEDEKKQYSLTIFKLTENTINNKIWKQTDIVSGNQTIDLENIRYEQAHFIKQIIQFTDIKSLPKTKLEASYLFSNFRKQSILNYCKLLTIEDTVKKYIMVLIQKIFYYVEQYTNSSIILTNIDNIFQIQTTLRNKLTEYDFLFNNTQQKTLITFNSKITQSETPLELQLNSILSKLNSSSITNKIILEQLKFFITTNGYIDETHNCINWINKKQPTKMLCKHYNYFTKYLTLSSNNDITEFYEQLITQFSDPTIKNDKQIYCKYCGESIATQNDSELEGFSDGSIMNFRDAFVTNDIVSIENQNEWKKEQLSQLEKTYLRYIYNFTARLNITMRKKDILKMIRYVSKQMNKSVIFNESFLEKNQKILSKLKVNEEFNFEEFIIFLQNISNDDNSIKINQTDVLFNCRSISNNQELTNLEFEKLLTKLDKKDDDYQSIFLPLINMKIQSGGAKKKKKKKKKNDLESILEREDKKKKKKLLQKQNKINKIKDKLVFYCTCLQEYITLYNQLQSQTKLFTLLSVIFVMLQVGIPDYKTTTLGSERESRMQFLVTDFYNNTTSLQELIMTLIANDKRILSKTTSIETIDYCLLKLTTMEIKNKFEKQLQKTQDNFKELYTIKECFRTKKIIQPISKWNTFKPPLQINKTSLVLLQQLQRAIKLHKRFGNQNYVSPIPINLLQNKYPNFIFEQKKTSDKELIYDLLLNSLSSILQNQQSSSQYINTIYQPTKSQVFLFEPLNYLNKKQTIEELKKNISNLFLNYTFEYEITEENIVQFSKKQIMKRSFETIMEYTNDNESNESMETNNMEMIEKEYDLMSGLRKTEIIENVNTLLQTIKGNENNYNELYKVIKSKLNKSNIIKENIQTETKNYNELIKNYLSTFNDMDFPELSSLFTTILFNQSENNNNTERILQKYKVSNEFIDNLTTLYIKENNPFLKEGIESIITNLVIQGINKTTNSKEYEKRFSNENTKLRMNLMRKQTLVIKKFIQFVQYHLLLLKNKYNYLSQFPGKIKQNSNPWYKIALKENNKKFSTDLLINKIKSDYPSISQKDYSIIDSISSKQLGSFYTELESIIENNSSFENQIETIFKNPIIQKLNTLIEWFEEVSSYNKLYKKESTIIIQTQIVTNKKKYLLMKTMLFYLLQTIKNNLFVSSSVNNSWSKFMKYFTEKFSESFTNIDSISLTQINELLDLQKAKENNQRKKQFDNKRKSEQNIHNIRRRFNLGNIELDNNDEITQLLLQEQENEIMNPLQEENNINENDEYLFVQGNIQNIPSEDNHDETDLYD